MVDNGKDRPHRRHECANGHTWIAEVVLSSFATGLSGERKQYCPECEKQSVFASEWINKDGSQHGGLRK